eukprot:642267-Hanusia_phi.AAC.1
MGEEAVFGKVAYSDFAALGNDSESDVERSAYYYATSLSIHSGSGSWEVLHNLLTCQCSSSRGLPLQGGLMPVSCGQNSFPGVPGFFFCQLQQEADADGGGQDHADGDQQPGQRDGRSLLPGREDPLLRIGHGRQVHAAEADRGGRDQGGPGQRGHGDALQHVDTPVPGVRPGPPAGQGQQEQQGVGGPQHRSREEQRASPAGPAPGLVRLPDHEPERPAPVLQRARLPTRSTRSCSTSWSPS